MEDVQQTVKEMNDAIFYGEYSEHDYCQYLELVQTPIGDYVKFMGCYIWDSENDYREWQFDESGEETDYKEDLKTYLLKEMVKVSTAITKSIHVIQKESKE